MSSPRFKSLDGPASRRLSPVAAWLVPLAVVLPLASGLLISLLPLYAQEPAAKTKTQEVPPAGEDHPKVQGPAKAKPSEWGQGEPEPVEEKVAGPPPRIFEEPAYDEIVLKDADRTVLHVLPLPRPLPEERGPTDQIEIRKIDEPAEAYEIYWRHIAEVHLFEELVLAKARALVAEEKFDEAYDYFQWLRVNHPQVEGFTSALGEFLFEDAMRLADERRDAEAMGLMNEVFAVDPLFPGLSEALGEVVDRIVSEYVAQDSLSPARNVLTALAAKFPGNSTVEAWESRWTQEALSLVERARTAMDAKDYPDAQQALSRALRVWPQLSEARAAAEELYRVYPVVVVGVTNPLGETPGNRITDWATRRTERLLHRFLMEYAESGPEGGEYRCPFGSFESQDLGRRLVIHLRPGIHWASDGAELTGFDVARVLIELADRDRPGGQADWADVFAAVSVRDVYEVEIELRWPHARPEALLRTPMQRAGLLSAPGAEELGIVAESIAPYGVHERTTTETRYVAQRPYFAATPKQPLEVVERQFATSKDAVRALRGGEIQVLDRIDPWDIDSLRTEKEIVVEPYDLPTVHCLLVNTRNLFLGNRSFRRALAYGMNRELILERQVLKRKLVPGCRLMSGPFAAGEEDVFDPQRYAYDHNVLPRKYDPAVAVALTNVALSAVGKAKGQEFEAAPTLKLAYPADEIARSACEAIQRHLEVVKIPIELVPLPRGQAPEPNEAYDLVYAAVVVQEPLTDARRLLGTDGVAGACAPYMTLALRSLDDAVGWNEVRDNLNRIHRLAFDDNVVIPLWQITEHFAYHQSVQGIGSRPALLYENIEQWQCSFQPTGAAP